MTEPRRDRSERVASLGASARNRRACKSRERRVSPHDRSRTRTTLRSYLPFCTRPQHTFFGRRLS